MAAKQKSTPNSKLAFTSAEAFLEVCKVLWAANKSGNTRILTLAVATNASFALEMYLKCLLILEQGQAPREHDLHKLFHALSSMTQSQLTKDHEGYLKSKGWPIDDLEELLKRGRNAFADFRYAHEQVPTGTDFRLNNLTYCVRERILKAQPEWRSALQEIADAESAKLRA
jgi:HEPN domain